MFTKDEYLSDNRKWLKETCAQCKNCYWRNDGTIYSSEHTKSCCVKYPYPRFKPVGVMNNLEKCNYYKLDDYVDED